MDRTAIVVWLKQRMGRPSKEEILEGDIVPLMFKLGWPLMIANLLQTAYNLADTLWLGRLPSPENTLSVGAMSLAWPFVFLLLSIELGLGIAAVALISQHTGAKRYEEANEDAGQLYFILILLSAILGITGYFVSQPFISMLAEQGDVVPYAVAYLEIIFLGFPLLLIFAAFSFTLRAYGDTITPMAIMSLTVVMNILLDPVLIFGWGPFPPLGIQGAAIATVFSRGVGAVISIYMLFTGKVGIELQLSYLRPRLDKIKKFFKIGLPATGARVFDAVGFVVLTGLLARLPQQTEVLAAYGIGSRIINITFVIIFGLGIALSTMVGQALGAGKKNRADRITKKGILLMASFMIAISIVLVLLRYPLMRFFIPDDPTVIRMGASFLAILAIGGPFFGIFEAVSGALNGSGHTLKQMFLSLTRLWAIRIPFVFIFAFLLTMESTGVWLAIALSNVIAGSAAFMVYRRGKWKEEIIEKGPRKRI
ncbi:MAG: MATE family efflux transporter [Candidatus Thermoplasmatota archaeon]|nr:MATE family efflux transporter [Candidatus Thermoplasmatota archaeon]